MAHWPGDGGSTINPNPYVRTGHAQSVTQVDLPLEERIANAMADMEAARKRGDQKTYQYLRSYLLNLEYIRDHKPVNTLPEEEEQNEQSDLDSILDAIFYASAIASIVPYAPVSIAGRIGMAASTTVRAFNTGNRYAQYSSVKRLDKELYSSYKRLAGRYRGYR